MRRSIRWSVIVLALLSLSVLASGAYADGFTITWTGPFGSGSVTVGTTNEGGGEFLITSLSGTQAGLSLTLEPLDTYANNDNLIWPAGGPSSPSCGGSLVSASSILDNCGFTVSDGTNYYNIYAPYTSVVPGTTYWECSSAVSACEGPAPDVASELTSFSVTPLTGVPEPGTNLLLLIGLAVLSGACLRRKADWAELAKMSF